MILSCSILVTVGRVKLVNTCQDHLAGLWVGLMLKIIKKSAKCREKPFDQLELLLTPDPNFSPTNLFNMGSRAKYIRMCIYIYCIYIYIHINATQCVSVCVFECANVPLYTYAYISATPVSTLS